MSKVAQPPFYGMAPSFLTMRSRLAPRYISTAVVPVAISSGSSNSMTGRLSAITEQFNSRVTAPGDPTFDADCVIYSA
jgi:hypothetical protein